MLDFNNNEIDLKQSFDDDDNLRLFAATANCFQGIEVIEDFDDGRIHKEKHRGKKLELDDDFEEYKYLGFEESMIPKKMRKKMNSGGTAFGSTFFES